MAEHMTSPDVDLASTRMKVEAPPALVSCLMQAASDAELAWGRLVRVRADLLGHDTSVADPLPDRPQSVVGLAKALARMTANVCALAGEVRQLVGGLPGHADGDDRSIEDERRAIFGDGFVPSPVAVLGGNQLDDESTYFPDGPSLDKGWENGVPPAVTIPRGPLA